MLDHPQRAERNPLRLSASHKGTMGQSLQSPDLMCRKWLFVLETYSNLAQSKANYNELGSVQRNCHVTYLDQDSSNQELGSTN